MPLYFPLYDIPLWIVGDFPNEGFLSPIILSCCFKRQEALSCSASNGFVLFHSSNRETPYLPFAQPLFFAGSTSYWSLTAHDLQIDFREIAA